MLPSHEMDFSRIFFFPVNSEIVYVRFGHPGFQVHVNAFLRVRLSTSHYL